ncbi:hypothetical protein AKO1_003899 [Acrasis kona]|uniref:Uncharacterized protein n=1 Tax=Acrasis kona TaxID=1008807 RepID=A0AAW2ZM45_9EUKA
MKKECVVKSAVCVVEFFIDLIVVSPSSTTPSSYLLNSTNTSQEVDEENLDLDTDNINIVQIEKSSNFNNRVVDMISCLFESIYIQPKSSLFNQKSIVIKFEKLLAKLSKYTTYNCRGFKKILNSIKKKTLDVNPVVITSLLDLKSENYLNICVLLSKVIQQRGSVLADAKNMKNLSKTKLSEDEQESEDEEQEDEIDQNKKKQIGNVYNQHSAKYVEVVCSSEKLVLEVRKLYESFSYLCKSNKQYTMVDGNHPLCRLSSTEIELLADDEGEASDSDQESHWRSQFSKAQERDNRKRKFEQLRSRMSSNDTSNIKRKKRRLRSRNLYVDDGLADTDGTDDYADLEDFIVVDDAWVKNQKH